MITLSENSKKIFVRVSDSLLALVFILFVAGFFLNRSGLERDLSINIIYGAVILALVATPIRLLVIAHLFNREGQKKIAMMSLSLIAILAVGSLVKWFFL